MRHLSLFVRLTLRLIPKCTWWDLACVNSGSLMCSSHIFVVSVILIELLELNAVPLPQHLFLTPAQLYSWIELSLIHLPPFIPNQHKNPPGAVCLEKNILWLKNLLVLSLYTGIADCHSYKGSAQERNETECTAGSFRFIFNCKNASCNAGVCSNCCVNQSKKQNKKNNMREFCGKATASNVVCPNVPSFF